MSTILDSRQLAERLNVTPDTVRAWARRGWIPSLRAGRKPIFFILTDVEHALRERAKLKEVARGS